MLIDNLVLTIIVPVYKVNYSQLNQCIKSVLSQSYHQIELILVDDASPDDCGKICDAAAKVDERVKVIHFTENKGVSCARNEGIKMAAGNYLMFVDADDWIEKNCCEVLKNYLNSWNLCPDIILFSNYRDYGENRFRYSPPYKNETWFIGKKDIEQLQIRSLKFIEKSYPVNAHQLDCVCGGLYRIKFLHEKGIYFKNLPVREDCIYFMTVTEKAETVVYIDESLYHYRFNLGSAALGYRKDAIYEQKLFLKNLNAFAKENNKAEEFFDAISFVVLQSLITIISSYFYNKGNTDGLIQKYVKCKTFLKHNPYKSALKKVKLRDLRITYGVNIGFIKMHFFYGTIILQNLYHWIRSKNYGR